MSGYYEGEILDITIRALVAEDTSVHHCLKVTYRQPEHLQAAPYPMTLPLRSPDMTITRVASREWPPQPGDVWRNPHGLTLFAYAYVENCVELRSTRGDQFDSPEAALEIVGPLELVYREGWTPSTPAAADEPSEPAKLDERAEAIAGLRELADYLDAHPEVPFDSFAARIQIHVSNLPHMWAKDEPAMFAELARIGRALGVEADLRDEDGAPHPHARRTFRGATYEAVYVTHAYKRGYKPADTAAQDITPGGEVAGPEGMAGPATSTADQPEPEG